MMILQEQDRDGMVAGNRREGLWVTLEITVNAGKTFKEKSQDNEPESCAGSLSSFHFDKS